MSRESSPFPGRWQTGRAEYQRGIMDAFSDPRVQRVVCMMASQCGKTEIINNICGFFIVHDPSPMLVLQPTLEMARAWSQDRLAPLINSTPALREQIGDPKAKDGDNTITQKAFRNGARLSIAGSNSPAGLASRPIRIVLMDEIDRMPMSAGAEGDPVTLATRRTANFFNRKICLVSTPTVKTESRIEAAFEESDQRHYLVSCPACGIGQQLNWSRVRWPDADPGGASYHCEHCDRAWTEIERKKSLQTGEWVATGEFNGTAGFHLNGLYSPWVDIPELARLFLESKHTGPEALRVFVNTVLAQTWEDDVGDQVEHHDLRQRCEEYPAAVPDAEIGVICGSVDVQADRLEVLVNGYSKTEIWVLGYQIFYGKPQSEELWELLENYLREAWPHPLGKDLRIARTFIDSGYETGQVYKFAKQLDGMGVHAIKGIGGSNRAEVGRPSRNNSAKCHVFPLGVNTLKTQIMGRLKNQEANTPGYIHFPDFLDDEFFQQLTAEKMIKRYSKGIPRLEFKRIRPRNEALDLMVYNLAAFTSLNANMTRVQRNLSDVRKTSARKNTRPSGWVSGVQGRKRR